MKNTLKLILIFFAAAIIGFISGYNYYADKLKLDDNCWVTVEKRKASIKVKFHHRGTDTVYIYNGDMITHETYILDWDGYTSVRLQKKER